MPAASGDACGVASIVSGWVKRKGDTVTIEMIRQLGSGEWIPMQISGRHRIEMKEAEQPGTGQPATRPVDEPEGGTKPQPEAEGRCP